MSLRQLTTAQVLISQELVQSARLEKLVISKSSFLSLLLKEHQSELRLERLLLSETENRNVTPIENKEKIPTWKHCHGRGSLSVVHKARDRFRKHISQQTAPPSWSLSAPPALPPGVNLSIDTLVCLGLSRGLSIILSQDSYKISPAAGIY